MKDQIGRICVKLAGRDAGGKCVIVGVVDKQAVIVTGPKRLTNVRRRKVNVAHLAFTPKKLEIKEEASDDEVLKAIQEAGLEQYMRERGAISWT
ncbi:MAG: 50S ribosomal protein L14e [Aigarchaeota archaeon]|nr:50S ribosomal protein L14e [Candidatus Pelearchaeum maunauluense]